MLDLCPPIPSESLNFFTQCHQRQKYVVRAVKVCDEMKRVNYKIFIRGTWFTWRWVYKTVTNYSGSRT